MSESVLTIDESIDGLDDSQRFRDVPRTTVMDAHLQGQILETDEGRVSVIMDDEAYEQMELIAAKQNNNLKDSCIGEEIFSLKKKSFLD